MPVALERYPATPKRFFLETRLDALALFCVSSYIKQGKLLAGI